MATNSNSDVSVIDSVAPPVTNSVVPPVINPVAPVVNSVESSFPTMGSLQHLLQVKLTPTNYLLWRNQLK